MEEVHLEIKPDKSVITLITIGENFGWDLDLLMYLYNEYGDGVFYFIFMLCGKKVKFPSESRLRMLILRSKLVKEKLDGGSVVLDKVGLEIEENMMKFYDKESGMFRIKLTVVEPEPTLV